MDEEMMAQEQSEVDVNQDLSAKLQEVKSLLEDGQTDPAMALIDECIAKLGGAQESQAKEMEEQVEEPSFKQALDKAFTKE